MSKLSKFSIPFFVLVFIGLLAYAYFIFSNRNSNPKINTEYEAPQQENLGVSLPDAPQPTDTGNTDATTLPAVPEKTPLMEIKKEDCLNGCKRFSENQDLIYCRQFCGAAKIQDDSNDCSNKSGLEKDYCFKDLAIKNRDFEICEKISDKGIQKTCNTRITEDILDEQIQN
ncbi:MAG: hypothetical protein ACD_67C00062G0002 [uncultured bacterium]|nr:MAG: hypothetical protein ACD_67C00062G0002 [uncultured bacterium]